MKAAETVAFLNDLADLATKETLPRFRFLDSVDNKLNEGFDPVTEADREAERVIRNAISERFPDHGIIGEEFGKTRPDAEYCWVIDPVDGTKAFIAGIPLWGTLVALCRKMIPVAGIMSQPFTDERFIGTADSALYFRKNEKLLIKTSTVKTLSDSILMTTSPDMFQGSESDAFGRLRDSCKLTRYGADCYAYCLLAFGQIEIVVETGLNFYDIAAIIPIIEGAGGVITDWEGNPYPAGGRVVAAANPEIHRLALEKLQQSKH